MYNLTDHPLFLIQLFLIGLVVVCFILRFILKMRIEFFFGFCCLVAIFFGGINYLYFGFPLDEGTLKPSKMPDYEFRFSVTVIGLAISFIYPVYSLLDMVFRSKKSS
jgi:hypothetical protein